jgi:alpha-L-fucosidase
MIRFTVLRVAMAGWLLASVGMFAADETQSVPAETKEQKDARMKWFREARFGMFIHWGVYSVPAGEWQDKKHYGEWFLEETKMPVSQYEKFAKEFNPVKFDAKEWVRIAKDAGMKYMVITSKHHDGFGMFRSELTDWCIKSTPFQRDPLKELADACKDAGITFCFYHSIMDWHHSDWGTRRKHNDVATGTPNMDRYTEFMKGQLKELLTKYGPIGIVWFDGEWESPWTHDRGVDLYNYCRSLQPNTIVNNRVGKGRAGMSGMDKDKGVGDYGTPEQEIPATGFGEGVDWESCMTMNGHWGYNKNDQNWKSTETLVRNLINCASKGGNYLLNVGPTSEGLIPGPSVDRLAEMGKWIKVNGESIYATKASPFKRLSWGKCTQVPFDAAQGRPGKLYLHVFNWPADGKLVVPGLKNKVNNAYLLADSSKAKLATSAEEGNVVVSVGEKALDSIATVVVLEIEGAPDVGSQSLAQETDGSITLKAADAEIHGHAGIEHSDGKDNIGFWVNKDDFVTWKFKVTKPGKFDVELETACKAGSEGSEYTVSVGSESVKDAVESTGSWQSYKTKKIGQISVPAEGTVELAVKALSKKGEGVMNLRSVALRPVK